VTPATGRGQRAAAAVSGRGRLASSFVRGYRNHNPLVLVAALALLLPSLLGLELFFTSGAWSDVPLDHWMRKASDDYVYVSWTVGRNKQDPPDEPTIYLCGGSAIRESITSGDALEAAIRKAGGPDSEAFDLGSMNQNFAQTLAIVDNVPDTPATVVVGINPGRFTPSRGDNQKQAEGRELLLKSTVLREYVNDESGKYRYTYTILPGILSFATSYVQVHQDELLSLDLPTRTYGQHRYNFKSIHTVKQKRRMVEVWNTRRRPIFSKNLDYNIAMLDELLRRAAERGIDVVLLELPWNREIIGDAFDDSRAMYQPRVRELATRYDVPYIDYSAELPLTNADFHDLSHLVEPGRVIWERRLAEELVRLLGPDGEMDPRSSTGGEVAATP
jgi:hypothetical protein